MASARLHMISVEGIDAFTRLTMSVSANTPHLAATWWILLSSKRSTAASAAGMPTFRKHLSIVAPVPEAHLSFMDAMLVLPVSSPASSRASLKMMILASWPPSSMTLPTSGCSRSTARVTEFTSWTNFEPSGAASGPLPDPVMKVRMRSGVSRGNWLPMATSICSTNSACLVWCRW
jgi:hypothetical protein